MSLAVSVIRSAAAGLWSCMSPSYQLPRSRLRSLNWDLYLSRIARVAAWLFLIRKVSQAGPSKASLRYKNAIDRGSPWDVHREKFRRSVRELLAFWVFATIGAFACLPRAVGPEDEKMVVAMFIALCVFFPAWALYRLIRFAIAT
jgi:hypothetical protein